MNVLIHAPSADALRRARSNARNFLAIHPDASVRIISNADGAIAACGEREPQTDPLITVCENTLRATSLSPPSHLQTTPAAIELIARLQQQGWLYIRA